MRRRPNRFDRMLLESARSGDSRGVQEALRAGADPNAMDRYGGTVLTLLAERRDGAPSLKAALDAGATVDRLNRVGQSALMVACSHGYLPSIRVLLRAGANPNRLNSNDETPLTYAIVWGHKRAVETLLAEGARPNHPRTPWTPLMYAAFEGDPTILRVLLRFGANPLLRDRWRRTPADIARFKGHDRIERLLRASQETRQVRKRRR